MQFKNKLKNLMKNTSDKMSGSVKRIRRQDIVESHFSTQSLFLIAEDAKLQREQTPENVELLNNAIGYANVAEVRRILIDEKLVSPNTKHGDGTLFCACSILDNLELLEVFLECQTLDINCECWNGGNVLFSDLYLESLKRIISDPRIDLTITDKFGRHPIECATTAELPHFIMHPKQPIFKSFSAKIRHAMRIHRNYITLSACIRRRTSLPIQIANVIVLYAFYFSADDADIPIMHDILKSDGTYSIQEILWMGGIVTDLGIKQLKEKRRELEWAALRKQLNFFYAGLSDAEKNKYKY
jgi:hypothetical protein